MHFSRHLIKELCIWYSFASNNHLFAKPCKVLYISWTGNQPKKSD